MTITYPTPINLPVTVVVCCYNSDDTIAETLQTLRSQTHHLIKILVIDDGSRDRSSEIIRQIASQDERIIILSNSENRGIAYSRQRGLLESKTDLIVFFDSDDLARPNMISVLLSRLMEDSNLMGVSCYSEYFSELGALGLQRIGAPDKDSFFNKYNSNKLYFQNIVTLTYKNLALRSGGFRTDILINSQGIRYEDFAEDLDLWCRMADLGTEGRYFVTVPEPLFRYRKPTGSLSTQNLKLMQLKMRWIKDCLLRRRSGQAELSLADFIASRTLLDHLNDWRSDVAAGFYKRAGFSYSSRNYGKLCLYLLLAGVLSPKLISQKIRTQLVRR